MFCVNCGNQLSAASRFCGNCGTVVSAPEPPPQPAFSAPPPPPVVAVPPAPPVQRQHIPPPPPQSPPQPPQYQWAAPPVQPAAYPPPPAAPAAYPPQPQPAYAPPVSQGTPAGPMPPQMHWLVVLILSGVTFGLGALVWTFKEARFVKKIDPASKAIRMLVVSLACIVGQIVLSVMVGFVSRSGATALAVVIMILNFAILIAGLIAIFGMRSSLVKHYTIVEPIGLRLSGVMTFFFSILYFQYHFSRIAEWKKTGTLR
jgi:zinc-ribbon domain